MWTVCLTDSVWILLSQAWRVTVVKLEPLKLVGLRRRELN